MKLHIITQYCENYGAHDWNGEGECPQYWKFKGGEDYFYQLGNAMPSDEHIAELVNHLRSRVEWSDEGSRSYIVSYGIVEDGYRTEFERSQLEYDGVIQHPAVMLQPLEADGFECEFI
jgi:hypothetical protein